MSPDNLSKKQFRLQEPLNQTRASDEALAGAKLFHVSQKRNRDAIETKGIKASKPWDDEPKGVYLGRGAPHTEYGDDVYEVTPKKGTPIHHDTGDWSNSVIIPRNVSHKEINRVGHIVGKEVHWHKEEDCPN
jgi:hypothetical protein